MEMMPFIDTLWYGEGFNYDHASADYWLTEISGLPLGLPSDMLRYAGTPLQRCSVMCRTILRPVQYILNQCPESGLNRPKLLLEL
jgi:hypothetical protein